MTLLAKHSKFAFESLDQSLFDWDLRRGNKNVHASHNCGPLHPGNKALGTTSACVHAGLCGLWCPSCLPRASGELVCSFPQKQAKSCSYPTALPPPLPCTHAPHPH